MRIRQRREGHLRAVPGEFRDPLLFREHGGRSRCTYHVSLQRFIRGVHFPPQGPFGMVPLARRYYETLRLPAAHFAALRFLRLAIPSLRPLFAPPAPDAEPWINLELVGGISSRLARWKRAGSPKFPEEPL